MPFHSTRRAFLRQTAAASVGLPLIMRSSRALAASDKLNIASVGVSGKGESDIELTSKGQNVVALCDVDRRSLERAAELYPDAQLYDDWRKMLEQKDIDAVTVSTPDHMHAPIAVSAMQLGKHVYVQKPLAHTVFEARRMRLLAKEHGVVTQMGNQNHSLQPYRTVVKLIQSGAIGKIKEVHTWSNRPSWPQGIARPIDSHTPPDWLNWENWLGVAPYRPYVGPKPDDRRERGAYHPFNWRGWLDFGVGALGDMGCHIIDPVVWSLELAPPIQVWSDGPAPDGETYPEWETIHYEFAGTAHTAGKTLRMTWYDGGKQPPRELAQLPDGEQLPSNGGLYIGEKGVLLSPHGGPGGGMPRLLPESQFADYEYEPVDGSDHYMQWTNACKGDGQTTAHFDYAGPLTETVLLGTIVIHFPGEKLSWDSQQLEITNLDAANRLIHHPYRAGWEMKALRMTPTKVVG